MNGISGETLFACLSEIAPLELKGTVLLRESRSCGMIPSQLPRDRVQEAVAEVIAYTGRCAKVARRLSKLTPIPLLTIPVEYGL